MARRKLTLKQLAEIWTPHIGKRVQTRCGFGQLQRIYTGCGCPPYAHVALETGGVFDVELSDLSMSQEQYA